MASRRGFDGDSGTGGKIRRRPPSRAAAASPYARPSPAPAVRGGEGSGWLTRLIAGGASRLLSSVFRKPPPQLAAPLHLELFDAPPSRPESLDAPPSQPETLDAPPSPPPPPLEDDDDIPEGEENGEEIATNLSTDNPDNSFKDGEDMLRSSDSHGAMDLEELLKQRTFTRSEFEYLADLLRSRTILKADVSNLKQMHLPEKENGSRDLPVDFSIRSYSVADQVASPAELAKAYMGLRSSEGSPVRLRLHDSSLPIKPIEANTMQIAKSPTLPPLPSSRLYVSTPSDRLGSSYMTPNRSAIHKMSSSPYFKSAISSRKLPGTVSSSYQTASSVHTFGRQVMKRKSTALNNESAAVGPIRKMHERYNRVSPLLETRPGYRRYLGSRATKLDEDCEYLRPTQKRRCLDKNDCIRGAVDNRACGNSFGQAPAQSTEMAAKILKQLDTLVPSQKEGSPEIRQKYGSAVDVEDSVSPRKEILSKGSLLESSSGVQEYMLRNNINGAAKFTPAAIDGKTVDATSDRSAVLKSKSSSELITSAKDSLELEYCSGSAKMALHQANDKIEKSQAPTPEHNAKSSGTTNKEKPPTISLRSYAPSNLVLSSETDRSKMLASSNGFSFPLPAALGAHSQAPPTPTMASPAILPVGMRQPSAVSSAPDTSAESAPRIFKRVSQEGSIPNKRDKKSNAENPPIYSNSSGHVASFTANPVFSVVNSKPTTFSNGLTHTSNSTASAVLPSNGSNNSVLSTNAGSSTASFPHFSFQPGFQTSTASAQQSGGIQFKAEPVITEPFNTQNCSTGGCFTFSNTGPGSSLTSAKIFAGTSQSVAAPSSASTQAGSSSTPFNFSPTFGSASSLAAQDKCKAGSSSTTFNFSPQFGTPSSVASLDKSKAESTLLSGNQYSQSGNSNSLTTQSSASNPNLSPENSYSGSLPSFANSSFGSSSSSSSSFNSSSVFSFAAGSGFISVPTTASLSLPATSSALGSGTACPASPIFVSNLATTAPPSFGMPNTGSAMSPFSSTSSPVFSFASATPTIPNSSPSTPLFSSASPTAGLSTETNQINGGHTTGDKNQSPFSTAPLFGLKSNSPSTPVFSTPATQFASTTSASHGIFQFGQQSQAPSGGFSLGTGDRNDKSGRRIIKVKRKK